MTARQKLQDAQARANELRTKVAQMWADAEAGGEVDAAVIVQAEAELAVADKMSPALQRLAQAEQQAEHEAAWSVIEAETLTRHQQLAVVFHDKHAAARLAMAEAVDAAVELDKHLQAFTTDQRRPPVIIDGVVQERVDRSAIGGHRLQSPGGGDIAVALCADGLDACAARGVRAWGDIHQASKSIREQLTMPTDPRPKDKK